MTEEEIVYDLMMEAEGFRLGDDSRWDEYDYVAYMLREKRAKTLRDHWRRNQSIPAEAVQNLYVHQLTKINSGDNSDLNLEIEFGKLTLPEIVSFHQDSEEFSEGIRRLSEKGGRGRIYQTSKNKFFDLEDIDSDRLDLYKYFFKEENEYYFFPFVEQVLVSLVLANPLDGFIKDTENKTVLVVGTDYKVSSGTIVHNSINYQAGDVFTAANTVFSGNGKVVLLISVRKMLKTDPYPLSESMMDHIKTDFIQKEFNIQKLQSDSRNDSADIEINRAQE